jgi:hypothetical protein
MKNKILLALVFCAVTTSLMSCKKDYTCKCSKTYTSGSGSSTNDYSIYTYTDNRVRAEKRCDENTKTDSDLGGDYTINCQIQ